MRMELTSAVCSIAAFAVAGSLLAACGDTRSAPSFGGNAANGQELLGRYGCGACHYIPDVTGASGTAGPPLAELKKRSYLAGVIANTPDNLQSWIMHPTVISPATAMPDLGVSRAEARDIAAFLYGK
jgi:cytochrome c2